MLPGRVVAPGRTAARDRRDRVRLQEEYLGLFEAAWRSNHERAATRGPFRVVGLNPCPDYETMHYGTDADAARREREKQEGYDRIMAQALQEQVLRPGRPALVYTGIAHATAKFAEYAAGTDRVLERMGNLSQMSFAEFRADLCAPRPDHGAEFRRRFRRLPDLPPL